MVTSVIIINWNCGMAANWIFAQYRAAIPVTRFIFLGNHARLTLPLKSSLNTAGNRLQNVLLNLFGKGWGASFSWLLPVTFTDSSWRLGEYFCLNPVMQIMHESLTGMHDNKVETMAITINSVYNLSLVKKFLAQKFIKKEIASPLPPKPPTPTP